MTTFINGKECLSTKEAADQAGLSVSYLCKQAKKGRLHPEVVNGNYFFPIEDFAQWLASRRKPGRPEKFR